MPEKMKISAVICELNPLHLGHHSLLRRAREASDAVVCILSGNFVQRGEPAVLDKWARCRLALENGADLVLELPLPWACAGAERFASGAVHLAHALGNVDRLVFGSEEPDVQRLERVADALLSEEFSRLLSQPDSGAGETFARRREAALARILGPEDAALLRSPNCILAVEYEKALRRERSSILPTAVLRTGAGHDEKGHGNEFRSAGELRELLRTGAEVSAFVPESTASLLRELTAAGRCPAEIGRLERAILCKLRTMTAPEFAALPDVSEGLENRLAQAVRRAGTLTELYALTKSKRYSHARIRRLVMSAFLGVTGALPKLPPYLRVLGRNDLGERILREASPSLPLAVRPADFQKLGGEALELFQLEARADDLYAMACPIPQPCGRDYTEPLIRL